MKNQTSIQNFLATFKKLGFIFIFLSGLSGLNWLNSQMVTFPYTGAVQTWTVPAGVTSITIETWGAQGSNSADRLPANGSGGLGGYAKGNLSVAPGQVINIFVGGAGNTSGVGGFNGGGDGGTGDAGNICFGGKAGSGGGASDARIGGMALADRVIVGGGGGGAGRDYCNGSCQPCGCGGGGGGAGGLTGMDGIAAIDCGFANGGSGINFGKGGSQVAGGLGGLPDPARQSGNIGLDGSSGTGGVGADGKLDVAGGGGGGGYFGGGGGGGAGIGSGVAGGGAGGGSSYIGGVTGGSTTSGVQTGDGLVKITYPCTEVTVTCPSNKTIAKLAGTCSKALTYSSSSTGSPAPTISYTFTGATTASGSGDGSGSLFNVGLTTVLLTANNACSVASCSFTITVTGCGVPIQLYHLDTTSNSAKAKWKAGLCASLYELRIRKQLSPGVWGSWSAWVPASGALQHMFTGLSASSFYNYQIRTNCSGSFSPSINDWFYTLGAPPTLKKDINEIMDSKYDNEQLQKEKSNSDILPANLIIVPNPAKDFTTMMIEGFNITEKTVTLFDLYGKLIFTVHAGVDDNLLELDLAKLNVHTGVHLVRVSDGKKQKTTQLMIER